MGYRLYELIFIFSFYCVAGRFAVVMAGALTKEGYRNKGICRGPFQPSFGIGALAILVISKFIHPDPINMFILGAVIGGFIELFAMALVHLCTGVKNHARWYHPILFGLGSVLMVLDINVMMEAVISVTNPLILMILLLIFWSAFPSDIINGITTNYVNKKETKKQLV